MSNQSHKIEYPRRVLFRRLLRGIMHVLLFLLTDFNVEGKENLPESGPLIVVGNHFSFIDPVAMVAATPYIMEIIAGNQMPNAPLVTRWLSYLWDPIRVYRGNVTTEALKKSESVLKQGGVLGIFPEAGSWAVVLRPARPGAAFLAARTRARLLPIGIDGLPQVFPMLRKGKRATVTVRIGEPFGPYEITGRGRERRQQLEEFGHDIMRHIAELIPPEKRGHYSDDPAIREAANGTEIYPWDDEPDAINR